MNLLRPLSPLARTSASGLALALAGLLSHGAASAQSAQIPPAFIGTWKANWEVKDRAYEGNFVISESQSTWKTMVAKRSTDPCYGRVAPMKLDSAEANRVRFTVQFSEVIPGCKDFKLTLRTGADNKLTGNYAGVDIEAVATGK